MASRGPGVWCAAALAVLLASSPTLAQQPQRSAASPAPAPPATPAPEPAPPPYEPQLLRLSEILGALSHLAALCDGDGEAWRARAQQLVEAEGVTPLRRDRLAGAFNRGFRGYQATHRRCTPASRLVIDRFVEEGGRLAREITGRFSG